MFLGTYHHSLDTKGRVSIPARYRELLTAEAEPGLILTINHGDAEQCVAVYPRAPFHRMARKLMTDGPMDAQLERYARTILPSSIEVTHDKQGRILIPSTLLEQVNIQREVTWVGMFNRMEIWDRAKWEAAHQKDLAEVGNLNRLYTEINNSNE